MAEDLIMPARELQRGDYLHQTRENGKSYGGHTYVQAVRVHGDTVTITAGIQPLDRDYPGGELVRVSRD
jgi:hypothetical protein